MEATITLPVFILCVVALSLIIPIIGICENVGYFMAEAIRDIDLLAYQNTNNVSICKQMVKNRVLEENPRLNNFRINKMDYLYEEYGIEDLIGIQTQSLFLVSNPIGILGEINFEANLLTRGFTGKKEEAMPLNVEEFYKNEKSCIVVIFPRYGNRYHTSSCRYVQQYDSGEEYQWELESEDAKQMGYTPCYICKGGEV